MSTENLFKTKEEAIKIELPPDLHVQFEREALDGRKLSYECTIKTFPAALYEPLMLAARSLFLKLAGHEDALTSVAYMLTEGLQECVFFTCVATDKDPEQIACLPADVLVELFQKVMQHNSYFFMLAAKKKAADEKIATE